MHCAVGESPVVVETWTLGRCFRLRGGETEAAEGRVASRTTPASKSRLRAGHKSPRNLERVISSQAAFEKTVNEPDMPEE